MAKRTVRKRQGQVWAVAKTLALAIAAMAIFASSAQAALVVTKSGGVITATGGTEVNTVTITHSGSDYAFQDTAVNPTGGAGCNAAVGDTVTCSDSGVTSIVLELGSGNTVDSGNASTITIPVTMNGNDGVDTLTGGTAGDTLNGGNKSDVLSGNGGNDTIDTGNDNDTSVDGGTGDDTLIGGGGADSLNGGDGNDRLDGGDKDDVLDGGNGIDRALYTGGAAINVDIDNVADDSDGEGDTDNIMDTVESITGSPGNDTMTGSCFGNTFAGMNGNDTLNGDPATCASGFGGDFFGSAARTATDGNDTYNGSLAVGATRASDGVDRVTYTANTAAQNLTVTLDDTANDGDGVAGTDNVRTDIEYVYGGAGADSINATSALQGVSLWGGANADTLTGSAFDDFIDGQAGIDNINCAGGSNDMYKVDAADTPPPNTQGCETAVP
jgi:Ca2+-binding RTX toxin-like protein